jgi:dephospho-CoA kinase
MLAIGLTGGIASGKSLAAQAFRALGAPVIEADLVAREVVAAGTPGLAEIRTRFGTQYLLPDGTLDRRKLREKVFGDAVARKDLERITHPKIRARLLAWRDAQTAPYAVLDVPILFESGMNALMSRVLLIDAPVEAQQQRLIARDGISAELARQMLAAQARREDRLLWADDVILNAGEPAGVARAVQQLHPFYLALAAGAPRPSRGLHLP